MTVQAIVVLGCLVTRDGRPGAALQRRAERAARAFHDGVAPRVIVAGGRVWHGVSEAQAMTGALVELGVPRAAIEAESWSLSTLENARFVAHFFEPGAQRRIALVTCDWHMPRALHYFREAGLTPSPLAAPSPPVSRQRRALRALRERLSLLLGRFVFALLLVLQLFANGCRAPDSVPARDAGPRSSPPHASAGIADTGAPQPELRELEALRDSTRIDERALSARDPALRRRTARALAHIADDRARELLGHALADEDGEVVAWAAYGLGCACRGHEPELVRQLAMRAAVLGAAPAAVAATAMLEDALAGALARCGGPDAEHTLRAWLNGPHARAESAALALGQLADTRKRLEDSSLVALLDRASDHDQPLANALFAFTRLDPLGPALAGRLLEVARNALARPQPERVHAIVALSRAGTAAAGPLRAVLTSKDFTPSERANAARELARLGDTGQEALSSALGELIPALGSSDAALLSSSFGVLDTTLDLLESAGAVRPALEAMAEHNLPDESQGALLRRIVRLRCSAARVLAGSRTLYRPLVACDPDPKGRVGALAIVRVLDRAEIRGARRARWLALVNADDSVVREAAIALMPAHPEIEAPARTLADALDSKLSGVAVAAARVLADYPDRAADAATTRRTPEGSPSGNAVDPTPTAPDPRVVAAVERALTREHGQPGLESYVAMIDAVAGLQLLSAKPRIDEDCRAPNPTLRAHAERALRLLGDRNKSCSRAAPYRTAANEVYMAPPPAHATLRFTTDAGELELSLDSELAPTAVARVLALTRAGFYDGMAVHRVVSGFVAQFGDRVGDGFGHSGRFPLPCETAPVRFGARSVGVALAGRDTGDSQLFVTFTAAPQLDGNYTRIGSAGPGWDRLAPGDVIHKVTVLP